MLGEMIYKSGFQGFCTPNTSSAYDRVHIKTMWGSLSALKDAATTAVSDAASYAAPVLQEALGDVVNDEPRKDDDDGFIEDDGETDPTVLEVGCCRRRRCPRCGCQGVQCVCVCVCVCVCMLEEARRDNTRA